MACTIEKVLADARLLVNRLKDHDNSADSLIVQSQNLHHKVNAMKQYQEDLNELNEIARHRPRANLVLSIAQENNQIRELQQENRELRASLEEHQSALELIMSKYREQVVKLLMANKLDQSAADHCQEQQEMRGQMDKICEMAAVMWKAIELDEGSTMKNQEMISQLQTENQTLRELLLATRSLGLRQHDLSGQHESSSESEDEDTTKFNTMVFRSSRDKGFNDTVVEVTEKSSEDKGNDEEKDEAKVVAEKEEAKVEKEKSPETETKEESGGSSAENVDGKKDT